MIKLRERLGLNARLSLLIPYVVLASLFIICPIIFLIIKAATPIGSDNFAIVKDQSTWKIMYRSIWTGLTAAALSMLIGVPFAYFVATSKNTLFKTLSISLMISPLFIFTIAKAFALRGTLMYMFDGQDGKSLNNHYVMILGQTYLYMPFLIIPVYSVFIDMPHSLVEASNDQGYGGFKTLFKVIIPYGFKAIMSGFALVFMLSSTSLVISHSLLPNGVQHRLIGNLIDAHSRASNKFEIATASSIALITIVVISGLYLTIQIIPSLIRKMKGGLNV